MCIISGDHTSGDSQSFRAIGNLLEHLSLLKGSDAFEPYELTAYIHTYSIHLLFKNHINVIHTAYIDAYIQYIHIYSVSICSRSIFT